MAERFTFSSVDDDDDEEEKKMSVESCEMRHLDVILFFPIENRLLL